MNRIVSRFIIVAIAALTLAGCSGYNKLLKSGDKNQMYRAAIDFYHQGKYDKTLQLFEEVVYHYIGTNREDSIMYYTGASLYKMGDFVSSEMVLDDFRRRFGRSPFIEDVEYMYAMGFYYASPEPTRDQTVTLQAIVAITEYLERYPESINRELCLVRIDELRGKLYEKSFLNAKTYFKIGRYKSAIVALRNALRQYPDTPHREEILYMTTKSCYELAANSIPTLQRDRYLDMMDAYYTFISEFPESKHRRELDRMNDQARKFLAQHPTDADAALQDEVN